MPRRVALFFLVLVTVSASSVSTEAELCFGQVPTIVCTPQDVYLWHSESGGIERLMRGARMDWANISLDGRAVVFGGLTHRANWLDLASGVKRSVPHSKQLWPSIDLSRRPHWFCSMNICRPTSGDSEDQGRSQGWCRGSPGRRCGSQD